MVKQTKAEAESIPVAAILGPAEALEAAEMATLAWMQSGMELRRELDELRADYREQLRKPTPADPFGALWAAADRVRNMLPSVRRDLCGLEPGPTKERQNVTAAELQLERAIELFDRRQRQLGEYRGVRGSESRELLQLIQNDAHNLHVAGDRLRAALMALGDQSTMADRKRVLELMESATPGIMVTV